MDAGLLAGPGAAGGATGPGCIELRELRDRNGTSRALIQDFGSVMRLRTSGNLCASVRRTQAATELQFILNETEIRIMQDGEELASAKMDAGLAAEVAKVARLEQVASGRGVFGLFAGAALDGKAETRTTPPE